MFYDLIDFNKVVAMTSLTLSAVNQNWIHSEWVSNDLLMDMKTITIHKDTSNEQGMISFVCLKLSKQMKRENNTADCVFILL